MQNKKALTRASPSPHSAFRIHHSAFPVPDPIVQVSDVRHAYGDRVALDGVSLSVDPGEIFVLLGPNGSGKTTLFRILSTLVETAPGHVRVAGHDPAVDR